MKKIELKDKEYFESQKSVYQFISCEYAFANLVTWGEIYDIKYKDRNGIPLIHITRDNNTLFPQIPGITAEELKKISEELRDETGSGNITQVPEEYVLENSSLDKYFEIREDNDFADYIHSAERLSILQGKKLRKKRNLISQFSVANPEHSIYSLKGNHFLDCLQLAQDCMGSRVTPGKKEEFKALTKAFNLYEELSLDGMVVYVNNNLAAFSVFSKNIDDTYVIHFEKSNRDCKGSAQVINQKTAEYLNDSCEFINREQDLGIPGLRKAKKSYDPDTILLNYELKPK